MDQYGGRGGTFSAIQSRRRNPVGARLELREPDVSNERIERRCPVLPQIFIGIREVGGDVT